MNADPEIRIDNEADPSLSPLPFEFALAGENPRAKNLRPPEQLAQEAVNYAIKDDGLLFLFFVK